MPSNSKNLAELLNTDTSIEVGDIANDSVTAAKLASNAVTTAKIAADAVTDAKVDITADAISDKANVSTGYIQIPKGTTAQRPGSPADGMIRYNSTLDLSEEYRDGQWRALSNVITISGGTKTTSGGYTIHTFTSSGTFLIDGGNLTGVDYLVVAGGGGGGSRDGAAGGTGASGGGNGGVDNSNVSTAGAANRGGGGGGGGRNGGTPFVGANGGSGVVVIRYLT